MVATAHTRTGGGGGGCGGGGGGGGGGGSGGDDGGGKTPFCTIGGVEERSTPQPRAHTYNGTDEIFNRKSGTVCGCAG